MEGLNTNSKLPLPAYESEEAFWKEIERRDKEMKDGTVKGIPIEEFDAGARALLQKRKQEQIIPELGTTLTAYNNELDEAVAKYKAGSSIPHEEAMKGVRQTIEKHRNHK